MVKKFLILTSVFMFSMLSGNECMGTHHQETSEEVLIPKTLLTPPQIEPALSSTLVKIITDIEDSGARLRLNDGSLWNVSNYFGRKEVGKAWEVGDEVVISIQNQIFALGLVAIHNLSKGLSVYLVPSHMGPQTNAEATVKIEKIAFLAHSVQVLTNKGTFLVIENANDSRLEEFAEGDILQIFLPQTGTLDGTKVFFRNLRTVNFCHPLCPVHGLFQAVQAPVSL